MTITFRCPQCKGICAFAQKHAGRQARCTRCQSHFIIPANSRQKPEKIKIEYYNDGDVMSGFYRAVFVKSWSIFTNPKNLVSLMMVTAAVCFKFLLANRNYVFSVYIQAMQDHIEIYLPFGKIMATVCWGILFWYYMEIINSTAFEVDDMPDTEMGTCFETIGNIAKSIYIFTIAFTFVQLPSIAAIFINETISADITPLIYVLAGIGLLLFPMALLSVSINRDLVSLFRIDRLVLPIGKVFRPYLTVAALVIIAGLAEYLTSNYNMHMRQGGFTITGLNFAAKILAQIPMIVAIRTIGLLHRHYRGFLL